MDFSDQTRCKKTYFFELSIILASVQQQKTRIAEAILLCVRELVETDLNITSQSVPSTFVLQDVIFFQPDTKSDPSGQSDVADQIKKFADLRDSGILKEEEFQLKKETNSWVVTRTVLQILKQVSMS